MIKKWDLYYLLHPLFQRTKNRIPQCLEWSDKLQLQNVSNPWLMLREKPRLTETQRLYRLIQLSSPSPQHINNDISPRRLSVDSTLKDRTRLNNVFWWRLGHYESCKKEMYDKLTLSSFKVSFTVSRFLC